MKRLMIFSLMFLAIMFAATAWSHHPAEGIVSDDIWQMVDDNLADTPHLDVDLDNIMDSMGTANCSGSTDCDGRVLLVTSIMVETSDAQMYLDELDAAIEAIAINQVPSGSTNSVMATSLYYVTEELGNMTIISVYEPVGAGESQELDDPKKGG